MFLLLGAMSEKFQITVSQKKKFTYVKSSVKRTKINRCFIVQRASDCAFGSTKDFSSVVLVTKDENKSMFYRSKGFRLRFWKYKRFFFSCSCHNCPKLKPRRFSITEFLTFGQLSQLFQLIYKAFPIETSKHCSTHNSQT